MKTHNKSFILSAGLAIFSMLFGAGNVIYPLVAGALSQDKYIFTTLGFLISSVVFGFLGTLSIMLFEGDFSKFFAKLGKMPGFILTLFIMCLIGPFGAMPRIVCVAYGSITNIFPQTHLIYFSIGTCLLTFFFCIKRKRILDVLGYVLTPILLVSLLSIIIVGLFKTSHLPTSDYTYSKAISTGFNQGNQTMDLFGALCFSSMVYNIFKARISLKENENKKILSYAITSAFIGLILLAIIYRCFIKLIAFYGSS
ncbi:MAG: Branched-chain amino acid transport system 2 carrier protein [Candidatus Anoxychlamydiales bacterium]|nr:Branched-chain amino acid transport system 2 carrier protein [Candidatus Anoxychlamydiales bacterium]